MDLLTYTINGNVMKLMTKTAEKYALFQMINGKDIVINIDTNYFYNTFKAYDYSLDKWSEVEILGYIDNYLKYSNEYEKVFSTLTLVLPFIYNKETDEMLACLNHIIELYDPEKVIKSQIANIVNEMSESIDSDVTSDKKIELINKVMAAVLITPYHFINFDNEFFTDFIKGATKSLVPYVYGTFI